MGRNFFQILPSEITTNILSRLPFRSVAISKCVCKSWLNLLNSDYFDIKFPPALVTLKMNLSRCKIFEIEDKDEADLESHDLHYVPLTDFDIPHRSRKMRVTAADGLLLLYSYIDDPETLNVCNPLTREYIVLCRPKDNTLFDCMFAFCVSKISGRYKVVCICRTFYESDYFLVYTLGTGIWRPVETSAAYAFILYHYGQVGYNGNLHYIVTDLVQHSFQLCGFDAETECFSIFSPPPAIALPIDGDVGFYFEMTVYRDCLC
ncbi:putative F-box protein At1g53370 [Salvia splendens]|uniref:putative F-box protein At1g53370 n=1 Tax=Salvia splendens TaxID=180675 RepID=UPI001C2725D8|nr:putative F-box protein At1g53370 [Salvia splendens]